MNKMISNSVLTCICFGILFAGVGAALLWKSYRYETLDAKEDNYVEMENIIAYSACGLFVVLTAVLFLKQVESLSFISLGFLFASIGLTIGFAISPVIGQQEKGMMWLRVAWISALTVAVALFITAIFLNRGDSEPIPEKEGKAFYKRTSTPCDERIPRFLLPESKEYNQEDYKQLCQVDVKDDHQLKSLFTDFLNNGKPGMAKSVIKLKLYSVWANQPVSQRVGTGLASYSDIFNDILKTWLIDWTEGPHTSNTSVVDVWQSIRLTDQDKRQIWT